MSRLLERFLDAYPDSPGWTDAGTSRDAALSVVDGLTENQARVFNVIRARPSTADEVAAALKLTVLYVRPRVSELRALGKIEPSPDRRENDSGRRAVVWKEKRR